MKDDRSRAFIVLVAVFLIGIMIGIGGSYIWFKPSADMQRSSDGRYPLATNGSPPQPPEFNLTSEQEEELGVIWKETGEKLRSLMHEQRERMTAVNKTTKDIWDENDSKVRAVLNQEQKDQFDLWIEEVRGWRGQSLRRRGAEMPKENRKQPGRR